MLKLENSIRGLSFSRVAFDLTIQAKIFSNDKFSIDDIYDNRSVCCIYLM